MVGLSVCYDFLKGREVKLPCSSRISVFIMSMLLQVEFCVSKLKLLIGNIKVKTRNINEDDKHLAHIGVFTPWPNGLIRAADERRFAAALALFLHC